MVVVMMMMMMISLLLYTTKTLMTNHPYSLPVHPFIHTYINTYIYTSIHPSIHTYQVGEECETFRDLDGDVEDLRHRYPELSSFFKAIDVAQEEDDDEADDDGNLR